MSLKAATPIRDLLYLGFGACVSLACDTPSNLSFQRLLFAAIVKTGAKCRGGICATLAIMDSGAYETWARGSLHLSNYIIALRVQVPIS